MNQVQGRNPSGSARLTHQDISCYRSIVAEIDPLLAVLAYHDRTKHRPGQYARALGYMDWRTQPDPFRRFEGAPLLPLEVVPPTGEPTWDAVLEGRVAPAALDRRFVSQLLFDSLALSAWKVAGRSRWSLRVNPSSGNLHPTEGYVVSGVVPGLVGAPAVLHYAPAEHALEVRRTLDDAEWGLLRQGVPEDALLVALTSIHWRESWKYGERALRYCHHDVGHAIAAVALAASALGWSTRLCDHVADRELAVLLGIASQQGPEAEHPDCVLLLHPRGSEHDPAAVSVPPALADALAARSTLGTPNALSEHHHPWPIIDAASAATERLPGAPAEGHAPPPPSLPPRAAKAARQLVRARRSAVGLDAVTGLARDDFFAMLRRVSADVVPLGALSWRPRVDLLLFVHRVTGLAPGLYLLVRATDHRDALRAATSPKLRWEPVADGPDELVLLVPGDVRDAAKISSCGQDIAADGAFAVAMLARFEPTLRELGADLYRRLHWEAGAIGQVLYLEAEAAGLRGTGIGCFFDDVVHTVLGVEDETYRDLYHFTLGGPVEDERIQTEPAYPASRTEARR